jgi:hypothetical protein
MHNSARSSGTFHVRPARTTTGTPEVFRVLDWTNLDAPPTSMDVARLAGLGHTARVAILVNTPRMLRAANTFSEQAGLHGVQVRVFVDSAEALTWLYKPLPQGMPKA